MREDLVVRELPGQLCQTFFGFATLVIICGRLNDLIKDIGLMDLVMKVS